MSGLCLLTGIMSLISVRREKMISASLFEQRTMRRRSRMDAGNYLQVSQNEGDDTGGVVMTPLGNEKRTLRSSAESATDIVWNICT